MSLWLIATGTKPLFLFGMAALAYYVCPRWHYLPFWLQPQAPRHCRPPSCLVVMQWSAESAAPVPELSLPHKQSALIKRDLAALMTSTTSEYHQARLKSPHSGD